MFAEQRVEWKTALPCRKEEECRRTPSASPEQPDHAWFCGEAYLHDRKNFRLIFVYGNFKDQYFEASRAQESDP